jgi:kinetochore protein Mis12/MTW1
LVKKGKTRRHVMTDFVKNTAILTEHLGYAPIALIDDIINAVNDILYKCTAAMETFLTERYREDASLEDDEIEMGTAKLETLLESIVDKCFDKFEIYVLRNLLVIPSELISEGWIRLAHHRGVDFGVESSEGDELEKRIIELRREIYAQKHLRFLLQTQSRRCAKLLTILQGYKDSLNFIATPENPALKQALKDISPMNESVLFLASQVTEMMGKIQSINASIKQAPLSSQLGKTGRDSYVNVFSKRAVESTGLQVAEIEGFKSQSQADAAKEAQNLLDKS